MSKWKFLVVCLSVFGASGLLAQDPSPDSEAFDVEPSTVESGARGETILLVANEEGLFSTNSLTPPDIEFGSGIALEPGSFEILNPGEAQAIIDVDDDAAGGIEVRLNFYSLDGTSIIRQERATIGIIGSVSTGTNPITLTVASVELVQVNVTTQQVAGAIVISGPVNGPFEVSPPAGTLYVSDNLPLVSVDNASVSVSNASLSSSDGAYRFTIDNSTLLDVTVTLDNLVLDTLNFTNLAGTEGNLSTIVSNNVAGITGAVLINAHTALTSLEGDDVPQDDDDDDDDGSGDDGADDNDDDQTSSSSSSSGTVLSGGRTSNNGKNRNSSKGSSRNSGRSSGGTGSRAVGGDNGDANQPSVAANDASKPWKPAPVPNIEAPSGGGPAPVANTSGAGFMSDGETTLAYEESEARQAPDERVTKPTELRISSKLYFADEEFKPISSIVLDRQEREEQRARIWIVLERDEDVTPEQDTLVVTIRLGTSSREVTLTETGKNTGVFHSAEAGIEIATLRDDD